VVIDLVMQQVELHDAFAVETHHLGIDDRITFDARRILSDARIAIPPIRPVHRVEAHPSVADVDLQPIAIVLEFVPGHFWLARRNETGRRIARPAAGTTRTRQRLVHTIATLVL